MRSACAPRYIPRLRKALASAGGDGEGARFGPLRLVPPPAGGRETLTPDPELKTMIDGMRHRLRGTAEAAGSTPAGQDAA